MQFGFRNQFDKGKRIIVLNAQWESFLLHFCTPMLMDFLVCPQDKNSVAC